jgi:hypothetical protein
LYPFEVLGEVEVVMSNFVPVVTVVTVVNLVNLVNLVIFVIFVIFVVLAHCGNKDYTRNMYCGIYFRAAI